MPLLKLLVVFAAIVLLLRRNWNLGLVLALASVAVGLLFTYPLPAVGWDLVVTSVDPLTVRLTVSVVLIMTLSELLRETEGLQGMVESLEVLIPSGRFVIAALPSLVGLLPMVGGAMFSAPMVDEVGDRLSVDAERKTFVNYWFRHIWEYVFPLYPSLMLAAALLGLETLQLSRATWPLTATAVASGAVFGLIGIRGGRGAEQASPPRGESLRALAASIWPVVMVITISLILPVDERITLILALVATIALMLVAKGVSVTALFRIVRYRIPWETVVVLLGALFFRRVLDNSGAVGAVSSALTRSHTPLVVVAFLVPFVAGLLTGLSTAAFSIGFPIVLPLVSGDGSAIARGWAAWLVAGGFLGVMCSPLHLCLSLTRVYFRADWAPIYRRIAASSLVVLVTAVVLVVGREYFVRLLGITGVLLEAVPAISLAEFLASCYN